MVSPICAGVLLPPLRLSPKYPRFINFLYLFILFGSSPPSKRARRARTRKGDAFPTNSYMTLPKGAPTAGEGLGHSLE